MVIVEVKLWGHIRSHSRRRYVDRQIRDRFMELQDEFWTSIVYGLSVMGTQVKCYTYKTQLRKLRSDGWHELLDGRGTQMMHRIHRVVHELCNIL